MVEENPPLPSFLTFVLTLQTGLELYAACITFYEEFQMIEHDEDEDDEIPENNEDEDETQAEETVNGGTGNGNDETKDAGNAMNGEKDRKKVKIKKVFAPKALCVVSYWPFYDAFITFLSEMYRVSMGQTSLPIEVF